MLGQYLIVYAVICETNVSVMSDIKLFYYQTGDNCVEITTTTTTTTCEICCAPSLMVSIAVQKLILILKLLG